MTTTKSPYVISRMHIALGTLVSVESEAIDEAVAVRGIAAAFEAIALVDRLMHPSRPGSDLTALAGCEAGRELKIHPWTWEVLALSRLLNQRSLEIFDPCLGEAEGRMSDLELPQPGIVMPRARMHVDLGGIAKGFAVDQAIQALQTSGCSSGLVNAGGDLAVFGTHSHHILCRGEPGESTGVELRNAALASSDVASEYRPPEHRGYYHGRHRGLARSGQITVVAKRAAIADGLTKCLLFGDRSSNDRLLDAFDAMQIDGLSGLARGAL